MDLKEYFKDRLYGQLQESIWNYGQKAIDTLRQRDVAARGYSDFVPKSVIQHGGSQVSPPRERIKDDFLERKTAPTKIDIARGDKPKFMPKEIPYDGRGRIPPRFDGNETPKTPLQRIREREIIRKNPSYRNDDRRLPRKLPADINDDRRLPRKLPVYGNEGHGSIRKLPVYGNYGRVPGENDIIKL